MLPSFVKNNVEQFEFYGDRQKVMGRMWGGHAMAKFGNIEIQLKLWHHGGDVETAESLKEHLCIEAVIVNGKYYDAHWYCLFNQNQLWLYKNGWFGSNTKTGVKMFVDKVRTNPNFSDDKIDGQMEKLKELGFVCLIS